MSDLNLFIQNSTKQWLSQLSLSSMQLVHVQNSIQTRAPFVCWREFENRKCKRARNKSALQMSALLSALVV